MRPLQRLILTAASLLCISHGAVTAAEEERGDNVLHWSWHAEPIKGGAGNEVDLILESTIRSGWILYASNFKPIEFGPKPAKIVLDKDQGAAALGDARPEGTRNGTGSNLGKKYSYTYFADKAALRQRVRYPEGAHEIKGLITGQACFEESGLCTLVRQAFVVPVLSR